jgi:hypothetical protein
MTFNENGSKNGKLTAAPGAGGRNGYLLVSVAVPPVPIGRPAMSVKGVAKLGLPPTSPMPKSMSAKGGAKRFCRVNSSSELS